MNLAEYRHLVVLTGAGISQSAGLPTYRGPGGPLSADAAYDATEISLRWDVSDTVVSWSIVAPPTTRELVLPALPAEFAQWEIAPTAESRGSIIESSQIADWTTARQVGLHAFTAKRQPGATIRAAYSYAP